MESTGLGSGERDASATAARSSGDSSVVVVVDDLAFLILREVSPFSQ